MAVIASFGAAAERFPSTFRPMKEEVLRELLLVVLNNQFGPAVGELFSRNGKTDIAIVEEEGPVFVAECKFWKGEKPFKDAIDQLLGYLVWRDTKSALVLFIKQNDVTAIMQKAIGAIESPRALQTGGPGRRTSSRVRAPSRGRRRPRDRDRPDRHSGPGLTEPSA